MSNCDMLIYLFFFKTKQHEDEDAEAQEYEIMSSPERTIEVKTTTTNHIMEICFIFFFFSLYTFKLWTMSYAKSFLHHHIIH